MKKLHGWFLLACVFMFAITANCQPVLQWKFATKPIEKGVYELTAATTLPDGWHIYAINKNIEALNPAITFSFQYEKASIVGEAEFLSTTQTLQDPIFDNQPVTVVTGSASFKQHVKIDGTVPATLKGTVTVYIAKGEEFYPLEEGFDVALEGGQQTSVGKIKLTTINLKQPLADCGKEADDAKQSLLGIFFLGFLGGLIALLTPCVFPMIPVTVSFFTKRSGNRKTAIKNGVLYGSFIFLIYVLLSVPFHIIGNVNPEVFNTISTNAVLNILFFAVFIFFAISFFGFFDLTLPGSIASKADEKSSITSISGIFFMSLTLAIVSFSCTGPILGSLLVGSLSGGAWQLTFGLGGFGIALALPFALFAIFPEWLKSLPKSGGWLDTVKKVLAFVELALAFKFLSNADLVMHWGLLKREVFIAIWIIIGAGLTAYLFGFLRLPHDYKGQKISTGRKAVGVIALLFTLYLIPGLTQSRMFNLRLLSGFPPPLSYSLYKDNAKQGLEPNVINDYDKALALSQQEHKPLLIDFTGWACVNCRKMEENVWTQPEVYNYIKSNYILVSLYVDDREKLPIEQRSTYTTKEGNKKDINTLGDKWATFQAENFNEVSQPHYVILNNAEQLVNYPVHYTPDANKYLEWLQCGVNTFNKK